MFMIPDGGMHICYKKSQAPCNKIKQITKKFL